MNLKNIDEAWLNLDDDSKILFNPFDIVNFNEDNFHLKLTWLMSRLLNIGELFQIVSMYSNRTLDCLKAAPTITTFLSGNRSALIIAYKASIKDLPKPRLAISMGNLLFHISQRNRP